MFIHGENGRAPKTKMTAILLIDAQPTLTLLPGHDAKTLSLDKRCNDSTGMPNDQDNIR